MPLRELGCSPTWLPSKDPERKRILFFIITLFLQNYYSLERTRQDSHLRPAD